GLAKGPVMDADDPTVQIAVIGDPGAVRGDHGGSEAIGVVFPAGFFTGFTAGSAPRDELAEPVICQTMFNRFTVGAIGDGRGALDVVADDLRHQLAVGVDSGLATGVV